MADMVGKMVAFIKAAARAAERQLRVVSSRAYRLPLSGAERQVAVFAKERGGERLLRGSGP
ncbi:hypothetical protein HNV28_19190 [Myxococcus xanthus]|uniref:Uncharacterized protein n=1 Tax=Myxococcus xanthus TaxID=34 RepID=A0A7Y4MSE5_MYXXA|nr:hypothetical protein [Myxococcus xanthus]NOJ87466.1 hypothetical protein [Myxococcus xanthus]